MKAKTYAEIAAKAMSEGELSEFVRVACKQLGLSAFHCHSSKFSEKGYPDWHILGPTRSLYRELKREGKKPTAAQQEWLDGLTRAGYDAGVWLPSDRLSGRIVRELQQLAQGSPDGPGGSKTGVTPPGVSRAEMCAAPASGQAPDRDASAYGCLPANGGVL